MGRARIPLDPVADLQRQLARTATAKARAFWTRYLRGTAKFRGVPMNLIRIAVRGWWREHGLAAAGAASGKRVAFALIEQPMTEDKLAGILVLQLHLGDQLRASDLTAFARLFTAGHLADWNVVDWFCMKVLVTLLAREPGRAEVARTIASWRDADTVWQRRAACVAFVKLAPLGERALPGLTELILGVCATVVWSPERFDQTAVGWVLRELGRAEPARVETFFRAHARFMTRECARYVVDKLPAARRTALLAHHKRATSLRR